MAAIKLQLVKAVALALSRALRRDMGSHTDNHQSSCANGVRGEGHAPAAQECTRQERAGQWPWPWVWPWRWPRGADGGDGALTVAPWRWRDGSAAMAVSRWRWGDDGSGGGGCGGGEALEVGWRRWGGDGGDGAALMAPPTTATQHRHPASDAPPSPPPRTPVAAHLPPVATHLPPVSSASPAHRCAFSARRRNLAACRRGLTRPSPLPHPPVATVSPALPRRVSPPSRDPRSPFVTASPARL